MPVNEQRRAERRREYLRAARLLFERRGTAMSIVDLADATETSVGAVYLAFASKDEILAELAREKIGAGDDPLEVACRFLPAEIARAIRGEPRALEGQLGTNFAEPPKWGDA